MGNGNGYLGSEKLELSVANKEIIPAKPENWTHGYKIRSLSLMNNAECTLLIDDTVKLYLQSNQGFTMNSNHKPITSLKIIEDGIEYNFIAGY